LGVDDRPHRGSGLHERDEDVDQLASLDADDGRAEGPFGRWVDEHLEDAGSLVELDGAGDLAERHRRHLVRDLPRLRLGLGEPDACHLRIREDGVGDGRPLLPAGLSARDVVQDAVIVPRVAVN
jgi:hypothetical protein